MNEFSLNKTASNELKGLAIILVIFMHLGLSLKWISGVSIFVLLSGFGLTLSYLQNGLQQFFTKRLLKVYVPYLIVTLVWLFVDGEVFSRYYPWYGIVLNLVGFNVAPYIDPSMWFIPYIIIWYCLFYLIFKHFQNNKLRIGLLAVSSCFCFFTKSIIGPVGSAYAYLFAFPLGVLIGLKYSWLQSISRKWIIILLSALFIGCSIIFLMIQFEMGIFNLFAGFHHNVISVALKNHTLALLLVIFFSVLAAKNIPILPLAWLGTISFEMYLIEFKMIGYFHLDKIASPFTRSMSGLVISALLAYLLNNIVRNLNILAPKGLGMQRS